MPNPALARHFAMTHPPSAKSPGLSDPLPLRLAFFFALGLAFALLATWFWSRFCRFPTIPWNDMRLAPSIAFAQGLPVYSTATEGTINTWMYGPLPVLFFWPASLASSAAGAMLFAGGINLALTLVPLALVCFLWPVPESRYDSKLVRGTALALCLAVWPELHYSVHFSDNLAIACALIGNALLVRSRSVRNLWFAAALATASVACKQICLGIPLAQIVWLGFVGGRREMLMHLGRCIAIGGALAGGLVGIFGGRALWFTLIEVPAGLGWAIDPSGRLLQVAPVLALQIGLPAVLMLARRRTFAQATLLLPALVWLCSLTLGFAGLMKVGGWTNSIHSFVLWLPPVLTHFLVAAMSPRHQRWLCFGTSAAAAAFVSGRIVHESDFPLRPQVAAYREAEKLARQFPDQIWFPFHPVVTLYAEHRYYHDEDGFYVRRQAHKPIPAEQAASKLPPALHLMAFHRDWNDWGIARSMLPKTARPFDFGAWSVFDGAAASTSP
ncbi:MAG: hypothetical protein ABIZ49_12275 [Opitutaceae bacterium]